MADPNVVEITEKRLGGGLNRRDAENQLGPTYWEDLTNAIIRGDTVKKRKGYQQLGGYLPFRVQSVDYDNTENKICFNLDSYVDLSRLVSSPLRVLGTNYDSSFSGFTQNSLVNNYYPGFTVSIRRSGSTTASVIPQPAHSHSSWVMHADIFESTSLLNLSTELVYADHDINFTSAADPQTLSNSSITFNQNISFIHASIDTSELGIIHYYPNSGGTPTFQPATSTPQHTFSEDLSALGLQTTNIITTVYERTASGTISRILPDEITIVGTTLSITVNNVSPGTEYFYVLSAAPDSNTTSGQVTSSTEEVAISVESPFNIVSIYTLNGSTREYVVPDKIVYDDSAKEMIITFQTRSAISYQIYYLPASLQVNQLCVEDLSLASSGTATNVELDVYGIDPTEAVAQENRNHWVTHIDTYRSRDLNKLTANLAGVEYELSSPGLTPLFPRFEAALESSQYVSPLFTDTGQTFSTTGRGFVTLTGGLAGPSMDTITFVSGNTVRFVVDAPGLDASNSSFTDNLDGTFTSTLDNDLLTVANAGHSILNGNHTILSMTLDTNTNKITIDCDIPDISNSDFDEQDVGGYVQVYTSPLTLSAAVDSTNNIMTGTVITLDGTSYTVRGNDISASEKLYLSDVTLPIELSSGLIINGGLTSEVVPISAASTDEWVAGDMVKYTGLSRWMHVKRLNKRSNETVTILDDIITVTDSLNFKVGEKILILAGVEGGTYTVEAAPSTTTIQVNKTFTATSGRIIGGTIELDESLFFEDLANKTNLFTTTAHWEAIPKPSVPSILADSDRTVPYPFKAFETNSQGFVRSAMVKDGMFLSNGEDPVIKYDGLSLSRAGLFRWEGGTFIRKSAVGSGIPFESLTVSGSVSSSRIFTASTPDETGFLTVGQEVLTDTGLTVVVTKIDGAKVFTNKDLGATTELIVTSVLKYYIRLNMIDANNNIVGSAVSGSNNDYTITLDDSAEVSVKVAIPPTLDLFDYDRLEVEIYRTKQDGAVFFKVATLPVNYTGLGYVHYVDKVADENLTEADKLSVGTFGNELATVIDQPMRAKYVTSANNRLVLGNLKDNPRLEVKINRPTEDLTYSEMNNLIFLLKKDVGNLEYRFINSNTSLSGVSVTTGGVFSTTLTEGDWYYIGTTGSGAAPADRYGWFKATAANTLPMSPSAGFTYGASDFIVSNNSPDTVPIWAGSETTDGEASYQSSADNLLFICTKLVNAINASQYQAGMSLSAEGRTDVVDLGTLAINSLDNTSVELVITHPAGKTLLDVSTVYINNTKASLGTGVVGEERRYPSRLLVSFPNFPEIYDNPRAITPIDSLSVIDVNSADGQEITGIIPFFGESTSQDSSKQDLVLCLKENSIYIVNINTRTITKIDSRGIGCDAPASIAAVPNGIIFASKSGVYRVNRAFDVVWVGRLIDRLWKDTVNLDALSLASGHVYPEEKQYRLSVPVSSDERATEVFVYNYGEEVPGEVGAWSNFTNIPSTGWASDGTESYFGSSVGKVFTIRNTNTDSDFRDDASAVDLSILYRAVDFGAPGVRKFVRAIVSYFRVLKEDSGTSMDIGVDLTGEFTETTSFTLQDAVVDGLSTTVIQKVKAIRQNLPRQRGVFFQVRYRNSTKDTPVELCGITFHVSGLSLRGITQADET